MKEHMGKTIRKIYSAAETKAVDGQDRTLVVKITTKDPDRSNDIVFPEGAQLDNYFKNPVVAAFHRYDQPPIGRTLEIQTTDDGITAKVEFVPVGVNPTADMLFELYKGGFMNAWSIGFIPKKSEPRGTDWVDGREYQEWELLEYSAVLVPDNPQALTLLRSKGFNDAAITKAVEDSKERNVSPEKGVLPYKETPKDPEDEDWDAGKEVAAAEVADLKIMCAWYDQEKPDVKGSYKLPHHKAAGEHSVVWRGVAAAMAALLGARGEVDIPDADRKPVYNHLVKHYKQFDKEAPEFKDYSRQELDKMFPTEETKEGRVLSEKNRTLIKSCVDKMDEAGAALKELYDATESAPDDGDKGISLELLTKIRDSLRPLDKGMGLILRDINSFYKLQSKKGGE